MASAARARRRRELVYIQHDDGRYAAEFTMGYVDEVTVKTSPHAIEWTRGDAEWSLRKLPAKTRCLFKIVEIPGIAYERVQPNPGAVLGEALQLLAEIVGPDDTEIRVPSEATVLRARAFLKQRMPN